MKFKIVLVGCLLLISAGSLLAHNGHKKADSVKTGTVSEQTGHLHQQEMVEEHQSGEMQAHHEAVMGKAEFSDFPTLHPLVVHFPIVLLFLAALSQLLGLFVLKEPLSWLTLVFIFSGLVGAWLAGSYVHPHTVELSAGPAWLLEQHEKYADLTLYSSLAALVFKLISHFVLKRRLWMELIVIVTLGLSAYFVATASHFGAQLTHIEGVGPQGHYLEMHSAGQEHEHEH